MLSSTKDTTRDFNFFQAEMCYQIGKFTFKMRKIDFSNSC